MTMILAAAAASLPLVAKSNTNNGKPSSSSSSSSAAAASRAAPFPCPKAFLSLARSTLRRTPSARSLSCAKNEEGSSAHHLFDGFSVLSSVIPWDPDNIWSTFAAYFFILHIPLSFGGLSITAHVLRQTALDPLTRVISAVVLQTAETIGAIALLNYTAKSKCTYYNFVGRMRNPEQRSWIKASVLGIGSLMGLVLLTSLIADTLDDPKDVNDPILKDILMYSPTSTATCFIFYCLITPLLEEAVYRRFLLNSLASRLKWWQAVAISSAVFSISHFSAENSLQLFMIGCVLGSVYCWTGNLAAPITVHSVYNATILLLTILS